MAKEFIYIIPEILVLGLAMMVLTLDIFLPKDRKSLVAYMTIAGLLLAAFLSAGLIGERVSILSDMFVIDSFGIVLKIVILIAASMAALLAIEFLKESNKYGEYYFLLVSSVLGMMIVTGSSNLIAVFLGIQLTSVPLYILAGFARTDVRSNEAALKYFLLGVLTAAVTLYGMSLLYGMTGTLNMAEIASKLEHTNLNDPVLFVGMTFVVSGFTFKIAAVPFHFWAPDTYEGAPTPVTAFIAAVPKMAGFAALVRLVFTAFPEFTGQWVGLFGLAATMTMITGNILAIPQKNIKRMLAFSGIAHVGYALITLAVSNQHALSGLVFYMIAYAAMNLGAFSIVLAVGRVSPENQIEDFAGLGSRSPILAGAMTILMLSMLGFPLTAGFMAKFLVFASAVEKGYIWLAVIGVANSVISLYYYIGVVRQMYMVPPKTEKPVPIPATIGAVVLTAVVVTMVIGIFPEYFIQLARAVFLVNASF